jgi:hypothetical protein
MAFRHHSGVLGLPHALQFLDSHSPPDSIHFGRDGLVARSAIFVRVLVMGIEPSPKHHSWGMIRLSLIAGVCLTCYPGCLASAQGAPTYIIGIGLKSCSYWQSSPATSGEGEAWIYGNWTGLNIHNTQNRMVGSRTDGDGIVAEVKKVCEGQPFMSLSEAVLKVYNAMAEGK